MAALTGPGAATGTAQLHRLEELPPGLVDTPASRLHRVLPGPTLVHLAGERDAELFVAVLQHGNEDTGLRAVQRLLAAYRDRPLPRAVSLFIGNVAAARYGQRHLDGQHDLNRCWPGTELPDCDETRLAAEVHAIMRGRRLFASVDVHNTSGDSPRYAGVNSFDNRCLQLARLFSPTVVHFTRPKGAQSQAFRDLCPAVILECGPVGAEAGVAHAHAFLARCLRLDAIPEHGPEPGGIDLFRCVAMVQVPDAIRLDFERPGRRPGEGADLGLPADLDRLNFRELPAGTVIGHCRTRAWPVRAVDPGGREVTAEFFEHAGHELRLRRAVMPSLLTTDVRIIRQDCLCQLMERVDPTARDAA